MLIFKRRMVRNLRDDLGFSRSELAKAVGCEYRTVVYWENGAEANISPKYKAKLIELRLQANEELGL